MLSIQRILLLPVLFAIGDVARAATPALEEASSKAKRLYDVGNYAEAETWAKKAVDLAKQELGGESARYANEIGDLAMIEFALGRYSESEQNMRRAGAILKKASGPESTEYAATLDGLARVYFTEGRYADAERLLNTALAIDRKALGPNGSAVGTELNSLASVYMAQGRYSLAAPYLEQSLAIARVSFAPDSPAVATGLNNLGQIYALQGRYSEAEPLIKQAVAIDEARSGPDNPEIAVVLSNLASLYRLEGHYGEAESLYKRIQSIQEAAFGPEADQLATTLNLLGLVYYQQGRFGEAEALYRRALTIFEKKFGLDSPNAALVLNNLALLYQTQSRPEDAAPLYERALEIERKKLGVDNPYRALTLDNLAQLYLIEGRSEKAEPLLKEALAIQEKTLGPDHPDDATTLVNLALLYMDRSQYADAEPLLKRAVAINEKAFGPDHITTGDGLFCLAALYDAQNRYADAEPLYKQAIAIFEKALGPDHPYIAGGRGKLSRLYRAQNRYADAEPLLRSAAAIEAARAAKPEAPGKGVEAELLGARPAFLDYIGVALHLSIAGNADSRRLLADSFAALQWSKMSATASATAKMAARFAAGSDDLAASVRQRRDAQGRLEAIEARLLEAVSKAPSSRDLAGETQLRTEAEGLRQTLARSDAELAAKFPTYAELANPRPLTIDETQVLLRPGEALVAFAVGDEGCYVAVVTPDRYAINPIASTAQNLAFDVAVLRAALNPAGNDSDRTFPAAVAFRLYQELLAPFEPLFDGAQQLLVVTDGALDSLPLGVLLMAQPTEPVLSGPDALRGAPWLARRYAISVLPSISSLKALRDFAKASRATKPFLGIGDPLLKDHPAPGQPHDGQVTASAGIAIRSVFRGADVNADALRALPSLPETADELRTEALLLKAGPDSLLLGGAATVTAVKQADLASRRIVAFATHGLLAGEVGVAEPGLVMTPPATPTADDDGFLKASDIAQLRFDADLVILSACNTAGPDGSPGAQGFSGLAKAFLYAGARALVVSHWPVASVATEKLMERMQAETASGVGRAEALRRAMLAVMTDKDDPALAHPVYWAPFVVVGEGGVPAPPKEAAPPSPPTYAPVMAVRDLETGLKITYTEGDGFIDFNAAMPATWSVRVLVDGDEDGKWGVGPLTLQQLSQMSGKPSSDFDFGMGPDGSICSQYIYTADINDPDAIEATSVCQKRPSAATAVRTGPEENNFVNVIYRIPSQELFQGKSHAHIAFEVWTGARAVHYFSAVKPLVIEKSPL